MTEHIEFNINSTKTNLNSTESLQPPSATRPDTLDGPESVQPPSATGPPTGTTSPATKFVFQPRQTNPPSPTPVPGRNRPARRRQNGDVGPHHLPATCAARARPPHVDDLPECPADAHYCWAPTGQPDARQRPTARPLRTPQVGAVARDTGRADATNNNTCNGNAKGEAGSDTNNNTCNGNAKCEAGSDTNTNTCNGNAKCEAGSDTNTTCNGNAKRDTSSNDNDGETCTNDSATTDETDKLAGLTKLLQNILPTITITEELQFPQTAHCPTDAEHASRVFAVASGVYTPPTWVQQPVRDRLKNRVAQRTALRNLGGSLRTPTPDEGISAYKYLVGAVPAGNKSNQFAEFSCHSSLTTSGLPLNVLVDTGSTITFVNRSRCGPSMFDVKASCDLVLTGVTEARRVKAQILQPFDVWGAMNPDDAPHLTLEDPFYLDSALPHDVVIGTDTIYRNKIAWLYPDDTTLAPGALTPPCPIAIGDRGVWHHAETIDCNVASLNIEVQRHFEFTLKEAYDLEDGAHEAPRIDVTAALAAEDGDWASVGTQATYLRTGAKVTIVAVAAPLPDDDDHDGFSVTIAFPDGSTRETSTLNLEPCDNDDDDDDPLAPPETWIKSALPFNESFFADKFEYLHPDADGRLRRCTLRDKTVTFTGSGDTARLACDQLIAHRPEFEGVLWATYADPNNVSVTHHVAAVSLTDQTSLTIPDTALPSDPDRRREIMDILDDYKDLSVDNEGQLPHLTDTTLYKQRKYFQRIPLKNTVTEDQYPRARQYRMPPEAKAALRTYIDYMAEKGLMSKSVSPFASPVFLVPKKTGGFRFICDLRALNKITIRHRGPTPLLTEVRDNLTHATVFTLLDLKSAFHQLPIYPPDRFKTAFMADGQLWEYNVSAMGLCNSPSYWCDMINDVLGRHTKFAPFVEVFIDDVCIHSKTWQEHKEHVALVMHELVKVQGWSINLSKSEFGQDSVIYCGSELSHGSRAADPEKIEALKAMKPPQNAGEMRRFLGLAQTFAEFVPDFAEVSVRLNPMRANNLHKSRFKLLWEGDDGGKSSMAAFTRLRDCMCSDPILKQPDPDKEYYLIADSSQTTIGACLCQEHMVGAVGAQERRLLPVAYYSKALSDARCSWPIHMKEWLALVLAMQHWHHYLGGAHFHAVTDHLPLQHILTQKTLSWTQARLLDTTALYDFDVHYLPARRNLLADLLSRPNGLEVDPELLQPHAQIKACMCHKGMPFDDFDEFCSKEDRLRRDTILVGAVNAVQSGHSDDGDDTLFSVTDTCGRTHRVGATADPSPWTHPTGAPRVLPTCMGDHAAGAREHVAAPIVDLLDLSESLIDTAGIVRACYADPHTLEILDVLRTDARHHYQKKYFVSESLIYIMPNRFEKHRQPMLYLPDVPDMLSQKERVLSAHHSSECAGHHSHGTTCRSIRQKYFWRRMADDVEKHVAACHECIKQSNNLPNSAGHYQPSTTPAVQPWTEISMDYIVKLPEVEVLGRKVDQVLVVVDSMSGLTRLIPAHSTDTAEQSAELHFQYVFPVYGLPRQMRIDRDVRWNNKFWKALFGLLGVHVQHTSPHSSKSAGQVERKNQEVNKHLRIMLSQADANWATGLPVFEHAMNKRTTRQRAGFSPYMLERGWEPNGVLDFTNTPQCMAAAPGAPATTYMHRQAHFAQQAVDAISLSHDDIARVQNKKYRGDIIQPGDWVVIRKEHFTQPTERESNHRFKWAANYVGPFRITEVSDRGNTIWVDLTGVKSKAGNQFNISSYRPSPPPENYAEMRAHTDGPTGGHLLQSVLDHRLRDDRDEWKVRWTGYGSQYDQWVTLSHMVHPPLLGAASLPPPLVKFEQVRQKTDTPEFPFDYEYPELAEVDLGTPTLMADGYMVIKSPGGRRATLRALAISNNTTWQALQVLNRGSPFLPTPLNSNTQIGIRRFLRVAGPDTTPRPTNRRTSPRAHDHAAGN